MRQPRVAISGGPSRLLASFVMFVAMIGCAVAQDRDISARSSDGNVEFHLTPSTAQSAFADFCGSASPEHCDVIERYYVIVVFDERSFSLTFVHKDLIETRPGVVGSIICSYRAGIRSCMSGETG